MREREAGRDDDVGPVPVDVVDHRLRVGVTRDPRRHEQISGGADGRVAVGGLDVDPGTPRFDEVDE